MYKEALCRRQHARLLSFPTLFRCCGYAGCAVLAYALAYSSGDMWLKRRLTSAQPRAAFAYRAIAQFTEVRGRSACASRLRAILACMRPSCCGHHWSTAGAAVTHDTLLLASPQLATGPCCLCDNHPGLCAWRGTWQHTPLASPIPLSAIAFAQMTADGVTTRLWTTDSAVNALLGSRSAIGTLQVCSQHLRSADDAVVLHPHLQKPRPRTQL